MLDWGLAGQHRSPYGPSANTGVRPIQGFGNRLGDLIPNLMQALQGHFGNRTISDPAPQPFAAAMPQQYVSDAKTNPYSNPFGASVTGGTLGAMLARQPTY